MSHFLCVRAEQLAADHEQKLIQEQLATEQKLVPEKDELALLKVKNEYDQANLECTFLEEDNVSDVDVQSNDVKPGQACPIVQYPVNVMSDGENVDSVGNNQLHEDTEKVTCQNKCESGVGFVGNTTGVQCGSVNNPVCNVTNDLPSLVNAMLLNLNIPKQEISPFDGDPAEYYMFIHNFEVNIESKVVDSNSRLTYLLQYCKGKAKRSIENCVLFGSDGYVNPFNSGDALGVTLNVIREYPAGVPLDNDRYWQLAPSINVKIFNKGGANRSPSKQRWRG